MSERTKLLAVTDKTLGSAAPNLTSSLVCTKTEFVH